MRQAVLAALALLLVLAPTSGTAHAKGAKAKPPSPKQIHAAIARGAKWLENRFEDGFPVDRWHSPVELVALTLVHAHADRKSKTFQAALKSMKTCELRYTYRVSVLAMALSEINPYLHRARLAHCAQWLVDTQCPGGEWGYPGAVAGRSDETIAMKVRPPEPAEDEKKPWVITSRRSSSVAEGEDVRKGDFSNTQYAILGLRACQAANIVIPKATWAAAYKYMQKYQQEGGGWGYVMQGQQDQSAYASLTCAGACGAAICLYAMGKKNPKSDPVVSKAVKWLAKRWEAERNVWIDNSSIVQLSNWQYYHLYSVERVGSVLRMKKIGKQAWYPVGSRWVVDRQRGDGSWVDPGADSDRPQYLHTADTCFAILFLAKATPPLTGG